MKRLLLLSSFYFFNCFVLAQSYIQGVIVNIDKEPIALTNVVLQSRNIGTITNEKGEFNLSGVSPTDSIKITNIAYYPKVIAIGNLKYNDNIILKKYIKQLDGIELRNISTYKQEIDLGFGKYANNSEFKLKPGNQIATFIENKRATEGWTKGVSFKVEQSAKCKNSLRIRLMRRDLLSFRPSEDLLDESIIYSSTELKKINFVDLNSYKIMLPKEGIFIVAEWLDPNQNCDIHSYTSLSANLSEPTNIVWFNFRDKEWKKSNLPRLPNGNYMMPNVGLTVAY